MEKDKRKNNDLQNTTQKFKDRMRSDVMGKLDLISIVHVTAIVRPPDLKSSFPIPSERILSLNFCVVFCRSLFFLLSFSIVLSVLRFMASGYSVAIFKLSEYSYKIF
jgi:hypothetical protein